MGDRQAILLLRAALGFVWIGTGVVCMRGDEAGLALIGRVGFEGATAALIIRLTSAFEIVLGAVVLSGAWRRAVAALQIALIVAFSVIITIYLPEWWLHPFGAVSKNVVLVAAAAVTGWMQSRTDGGRVADSLGDGERSGR